MNHDTNVVYKDIDHTPALTYSIHKKIEKLSRFSRAITHSKVILDSPHKNRIKGKLYRASIEVGVKGFPVIASHEDTSVHIAVRNAFNAAERKLKAVSKQSKH